MRMFKSKKKLNIKIIWIFLILSIVLITLTSIKNIPKLNSSNEKLILCFLNDTNSYIESESNVFNDFIRYAINLDDPFSSKTYEVVNTVNNLDFDVSIKPRVYIYNTHDSESYLGGSGVFEAAKLIEHKLKDIGISSIIENRKVTPYLDTSYSTFHQAYAISRKYLESVLAIYEDFDLIIDLHRDSVNREYSYATIDGVNYAKILFVQGVRYDHYKDNLALVTKISDKLKAKYPGISKGIMIKDKDYQHDNYNQDLSSNAMLLELGSNNNTWEEVTNTIDILIPILKEVMDEKESN